MAVIESSCTTLYRTLVTFAMSSAVSVILWAFMYAESHNFQYPTLISVKIWGVPFGIRDVVLGTRTRTRTRSRGTCILRYLTYRSAFNCRMIVYLLLSTF